MAPRQLGHGWAWLICFIASLSYGLGIGFMLSFGVVFPVLMDHFGESLAKTALVGSIGVSMMFTASPLTAILIQQKGCRFTAMTGALSCVLGLIASSFVQRFSILYLTYSLICGTGVSCIYMSCYMVVTTNFEKRRLLATGLVTSGAAMGVLVIAPLFQIMLDSFGWRNAYRAMAGAFLGIFLADVVLSEPETTKLRHKRKKGNTKEEQTQEKMLDLSVCKVPEFIVFASSVALHCFGLYIPQIYLVKYCESLEIGGLRASRLFVFHGICSLIGRIISGRLSDMQRINKTRLYQFAACIPAVATLGLPTCRTYTHLVVFSCCYGLGEGMFATMGVVVLMHGMQPKQKTSSLGIGTMCYGISSACGAPLAGFIADNTGSYEVSFYIAGGAMLVALMLPFLLYLISKQSHIDYAKNVPEISLDFRSSESKNCDLIVERETVV